MSEEGKAMSLVRPWVGKLHHARGLCDGWGCIRDDSGKMVIQVNCGWMLEKDLYQHRKNETDPTQPAVDYLMEVLNAPLVPLPAGMTRDDAVLALRELRDLATAAQAEADPGFSRWPDLDALIEHIAEHGLPPNTTGSGTPGGGQ